MLFDQLLLQYGDLEGFCVLGAPEREWYNKRGELEIYLEPYARVTSHAGHASIKDCAEERTFQDPWSALRLAIRSGPVFCAGFISYETSHLLERICVPESDFYNLVDYCFYLYRTRLRVPREGGEVQIDQINAVPQPFWQAQLPERVDFFNTDQLERSFEPERLARYSNFSQERYEHGVRQIKEYILDGKVYQVNLSQQFKLPYHFSAQEYYRALRIINPAQFEAYVALEDAHIVSASPELFFNLKDGEATVSPIKGTAARGAKDSGISARMLSDSDKERAELAMIVDLMRNDLGRVSEVGSVWVLEHARVESLPFLYHLVSDVNAKLLADADLFDLIKAIFPCGSISGAPKIAAMNIISQLEQTKRGIFSGAIGVITSPKDARFNVAIRSALISQEKLIFQTGGGVTIDSDPASEYRESMLKARGLFQAWERAVGI